MNFLTFTDQNGTQIPLGNIVKATKGKNRGGTYVFVFCIPQHRFGFIYEDTYEEIVSNNEKGLYGEINMVPEPFVLNTPDLHFYWTPNSKKQIIMI